MSKENKNNKVKALLKELFAIVKTEKFLDAPLNDGVSSIRTTDETIKEGSPVQLVTGDGTVTDANDGEFTLADGSVITVSNKMVSAIKPGSGDEAMAKKDKKKEEAAPTAQVAPTAPAVKADAEDGDDEEDEDMAKQKGNGPEVDMDADGLSAVVEAIKALADRIAAIEDKVSSTKMEVAKMNEVINEGEESSAALSLKAVGYAQGTIGHTVEMYKKTKQNRKFANLKALNELRGTPMKTAKFSTDEDVNKLINEKFKGMPTAPKADKEEKRTEKFSAAPSKGDAFDIGFGNMSFS